ncbi:uncharacterized protein LOC113332669 [Papaver somniferum]|uniref:uncharacterized protein LOC113332669 n=1 Tax=Papaver somniferum TaxID=3469 RepID=UPI000E6FAEA7|nr:uncharacterized protein LOC113332669 [Papaver somniferum]
MRHPIDDCRSPVADDAEMGIEVYTEFVNNYFGGLDSFDFLHPQLYKKKGNANEAQNDKNCGVVEECNPKGKEVVVVPSDTDSGDSASSSDSEDEEGTLSVQGVAADDGQKCVWGSHVEAAERTSAFDDDTGDADEFLDVDTMFVGMEFMDRKDFKKHLRACAVKKKFQYKLRPNDKESIKVNCKYNKSQSCEFFIYASVRTGEPTFILRKMNLEHTCVTEGVTRNRTSNAEFVAQFLYDKLKNGDPMPILSFLLSLYILISFSLLSLCSQKE